MIRAVSINNSCINFKSFAQAKAPSAMKVAESCNENTPTRLYSSGNSYIDLTDKLMYERLDKATDAIKSVLDENEVMKAPYYSLTAGPNIVRTLAGHQVEGTDGAIKPEKSVACHFDKNGNIERIFVLDRKTNAIDVYNKDGDKTHHFGKRERAALFYYKYNPHIIHEKLRSGIDLCTGNRLEEAQGAIIELEKIFSNESKFFRTNEDKVVYRALQNGLTDEERKTLHTKGAIFEDKSYCSVTESLKMAEKYKNLNDPIMRIQLPKDSKYADVESLFNIDKLHFQDEELLLDKDSKFLITGFDKENNIVEAIYLSPYDYTQNACI